MNPRHPLSIGIAYSQALFTVILTLTVFTPLASSLTIFNSSDATYYYYGCWNETTELLNTTQLRALDDGISVQLPGSMTVPLCLDYCAHNTSTQYKYAGLEYSRECWCAGDLNPLSARLPDSQCDNTCDGDTTTACGGPLRLSVYELSEDKTGAAVPMRVLLSGVMDATFWLVSLGLVIAGL